MPQPHGRRRGCRNLKPRPERVVDAGRVVLMHYEKGMSVPELAELYGVDQSCIERALEPFRALIENPDESKAFVQNEGVLLDALRSKIVRHMARDDVIEKASLNNAAFALERVNSIVRLLRGQSTSNLAVRTEVLTRAHQARKTQNTTDDQVEGDDTRSIVTR